MDELKKILRKIIERPWMVAAVVGVLALILFAVAMCIERTAPLTEDAPPLTMYDIEYERFEMVEGEVESGETMGQILAKFGVGAAGTHRIGEAAKGVFDLGSVRAGRKYVAFFEPDTLSADTIARPRLAHFVYERDMANYAVVSFLKNDSIGVRTGSKPVRIERIHAKAHIETSMWGAIVEAGMSDALAAELEDVFGWSVDFFGLQQGDSFEVIYDQGYVDSTKLNNAGQIWGAVFHHSGKDIYAIPFKQDGKIRFWDENGNSLKKQFLKAPLKFSRVTSGFSYARRHPITRRVRPHLAVDYGAPTGTPIFAVADGTVTRRYWDRSGGGNTLWLKHSRGYETGYLHLSRFANIKVGSRVSQGQIIGYVGSTGGSTGPHLDYRIRLNGKPINPLKIPQEPGLPIKKENLEAFSVVKAKVMGELAGTLVESERLTSLDSIGRPSRKVEIVTPVDTLKNGR